MNFADIISTAVRPCPREVLGYNCHSYLPTGCEECGRGRPKPPRRSLVSTVINKLTHKEN